MVKLFKRTLHILGRRQTSILSAASIIMTTVLFSRILGLWRDRLLAARFAPKQLGVYYAAFRLPNMLFELLVMGALSTAFIPVFTTYLDTKGKKEAFKMASSVINIGLAVFTIFSLPILFYTHEISLFLAPGFNKDQIELMVSFTRIMIIAQVFPLIIGNFFTGVLQSLRNFIVPSLAPIAYNLGIILGIVILSPSFGLYAPVIGVVIGAVLFTLIQVPLFFSAEYGYRYKWSLSFSHPGARKVGRLMLPRVLGLAVSQIDATVDLILASFLGSAAVTIFNFAQHLQQVPIGLFGASIAQATLPTLSFLEAQKNRVEFKRIFLSSFHQIIFLVIPVSAILIVLRIPLVRLVFGASTLFDWKSTVVTGKTLAFFSISLFAQSLVHLLARSFYALHDSKTPVIIGAFCVLLNTILSFIFILYYRFDVWGLGFSTSIASIVNMAILLLALDKKVGRFKRYDLFMPVVKIFLSGMVTGVALYIPIKLFDQLVFDTTRTINLLFLTFISTISGLSVYLFLAWFLEVPQINMILTIFKKAKGFRRRVIIDTTQEVVNVQEAKV